MKRSFSFFYAYMQFWVNIALRVFFKNILVHYEEELPKDQPLMYCGNHQNAFLDALLIAVITNTQPASLVRADIFQNKTAAWLLGTLRMMPIYRIRDGIKSMNKNDEIFQQCYDLLSRGDTLIIFPEGNHGDKRKLRPLKKGAARIAFGALDQFEKDNQDLKIVPIGINYNHHSKFRSNVVVNFGKPISVRDYESIYRKDAGAGIKAITQELSSRMRRQMLDISVGDFYSDASSFLEKLYPATHRNSQRLARDYNNSKALADKFTVHIKQNGENELEYFYQKVRRFNERHAQLKEPPLEQGIQSYLLWLVLLFPFFAVGAINFYLPYKLISTQSVKLFKDPQFIGSMKVAMGLLLFPLYLTVFAVTLGLIFSFQVGLLYFVGSLLIGIISLIYIDLKNETQRVRIMRKKLVEAPDLMKELDDLQNEIIDLVEQEKPTPQH